MTKAFDFADLGDKLKAKGLPVLEETAKQVYEGTKEWLLESAALKGGILGGIIPVAISAIDAFVEEKIDSIDGVKGN